MVISQDKKLEKTVLAVAKAYDKNKPRDAKKHITKMLSHKSIDPSFLFQAAIAAYNASDFETAEKLCGHTAKSGTTDKNLLANLYMLYGALYSATDRRQQSIDAYRTSLSHNPNSSGCLNNLGLALKADGLPEEALKVFKSAHAVASGNIGIMSNLADLLTETGRYEDAVILYNDSLLIQPDSAELHCKAGKLIQSNAPLEALTHFQKAVHLQPENINYLRAYSEIFEFVPLLKGFAGLGDDLARLLSSEGINWAKLNKIVPVFLKNEGAFKDIQPLLADGVKTGKDITIDYGKVIKALSHPVFILALGKMRLLDPEIEKLLELFRRQTLIAISSAAKIEKPLFDLLRALLVPLADFCFTNEYVLNETDFEKEHQNNIFANFDAGQVTSDQDFILKFLILCCYQSAHRLPIAPNLKNDARLLAQKDLAKVYQQQISESAEEESLKRKIKQVTPIDDDISKSVQAQYEQNPYPRWKHLPATGVTSYAKHIEGIIPSLANGTINLPEHPDVLIAGCGTGRQPISTAKSFPETKLLAIDLSLTSISYAQRKARELKVKNITFGQADIMELGSLQRKFHIIECAGVLHHMNDPVAGWRVLTDMLEDDGYMLIGLYSELGRQDIIAARQFIKDNNYSDTIDDIRHCRKAIMALDDSHPTRQIIRHNDFYTTSACRDLIFHVQEHRFTLLQISDILESLGLEFLGFQLDRKSYEADYSALYPDDKRQTNLHNWHEFETRNPETFAAMYKFWIRKKTT